MTTKNKIEAFVIVMLIITGIITFYFGLNALMKGEMTAYCIFMPVAVICVAVIAGISTLGDDITPW